MGNLIWLIILFVFFILPKAMTDYTFNNRTSPPGYRTDWAAMNRDTALGKSNTEIKEKFNRGDYDIPL